MRNTMANEMGNGIWNYAARAHRHTRTHMYTSAIQTDKMDGKADKLGLNNIS